MCIQYFAIGHQIYTLTTGTCWDIVNVKLAIESSSDHIIADFLAKMGIQRILIKL